MDKLMGFNCFMKIYKLLFFSLLLVSSVFVVCYGLQGGYSNASKGLQSAIVFSFFLWIGVNLRAIEPRLTPKK